MHAVIGFHGPSRLSPERFPFSLLHTLLGGNMSSRLFEEVREKRGLAYEIRSHLALFQDTGAFTISEGVERQKLPVSLRVILRELEKIRSEAVGEDELRRAKDYYLGQLSMGLEDTLDHMIWMGEKVLCWGCVPDRPEIEERIRRTTAREIQSVARKYLRTRNLNLACIGPVEKAEIQKIKKEFFLDE